jgi:hypothetical protein
VGLAPLGAVVAVGAAALQSKPVAGSEVLVVVPLAKGFSDRG